MFPVRSFLRKSRNFSSFWLRQYIIGWVNPGNGDRGFYCLFICAVVDYLKSRFIFVYKLILSVLLHARCCIFLVKLCGLITIGRTKNFSVPSCLAAGRIFCKRLGACFF